MEIQNNSVQNLTTDVAGIRVRGEEEEGKKNSPQNFPHRHFAVFPSPASSDPSVSLRLTRDVTPAIIHTRRALSGQIRSGEPAPRQPSYSINIVTAEEPPVLTSPARAETIEGEETSRA